jgi:COMPASS component SWD3
VFRGHTNHVLSVDVTPRGSLLASGSFDESIRLWDTRTARCIRVIAAHSEPVTSLRFNADGTLLLSSSYDGLIRIWDTATQSCLRTIQDEGLPPVATARYTPNGKYVVASTLDNRVRLWDISGATSRPLKTYTGHLNRAFCLGLCVSATLSRGAQAPLLLSGSEDGRVVAWDVQSRLMVQSWEHSVHPVAAPTATVAAGAAAEAGASAPTEAPVKLVPAPVRPVVMALDAHPYRDLVASGAAGTDDFAIRLWSDPYAGAAAAATGAC